MTRLLVAIFAALFLFWPCAAAAHDIPNDVTVQAFVKPQGSRLHLLVRVPLKAMRDINFPERGPGHLDLAQVGAMLPGAATLWISDFIEVYENDTRLSKPRIVATRISLPSDRSFSSFEEALAHVTGPTLPDDANVYWDQTMLDVLFEYPIQSEQSRFSIHPAMARLGLRVVTVLRFLPAGGGVRAFEFNGDPGLVRLDPRWHQAALRFVDLGFFHILDGTDHLLFLLCLVIPFRRLGALIPVVTAFTIAHSITLIASAYNLAPNFLWFPPLIETLIAISFAGSHLLTSLLSFNVGVELGQLLVLVLLIPALKLLFRCVVAERTGAIILSALVAHTGWHWMLDRGHVLGQFRFEWPALTAALLASAVRWLMVLLILGGLLWFLQKTFQRWAERTPGVGWMAFARKVRIIGVSTIARSALSGDSQEGGRGQ